MNKFNQIDVQPELIATPNPRIGLVALSTDFTIEQDYRRLCHSLPVDIFMNRIPFENPLNQENYLKMIDHLPNIVENILPNQNLNTVAYGCTSGTIAIGEKIIAKQIHKTKPNSYITTPITAALRAFEKLRIKKLAVLAPYPKEVNQTVFDYLNKKNIEVLNFSSFNLHYDSEIAMVDPANIIKTIKNIDHSQADAVFVSCTALRAVEILEEVENIINKTVISSNQAIIWDSIRSVGINDEIKNFGKLMRK